MTHPRTTLGARSKEELGYAVFAAACVLAVAALFYVPAWRMTGAAGTVGVWPTPLDDVYIHYAFARSAAELHPFEWWPGGGYSSGNTSPLYPLLLAPGIWLGLSADRLGIWASALACVALWDLCRVVRRLVFAFGGVPSMPRRSDRTLTWLFPPLLLAIPLLDWTLLSGMEIAVWAAVAGRAVLASVQAVRAPPAVRSGAQLRAGLIIALLPLLRPETAVLGALLAVAVAHGAGSLSAVASLARAFVPMAIALGAQALANRAWTGEWSAAGAVRKLLLSNPYASGLETAIEVLKNSLVLRAQGFEVGLGGLGAGGAAALLAIAGAMDPRTRRWVIALGLGAAGVFFLVSLNATAQYQNLRYLAPSLLLMLLAAMLGASALGRRGVFVGGIGVVLLVAIMIGPIGRWSREIDHFARASKNIAEQQVTVGRRLASLPRDTVLMVGDAGAIPHLSGLRTIDGLGLGGYRDLPFARASVHGVPAVIELIERLPEAERPDVLALYPSWWPGLVDRFGERWFDVTIDDNVICGAPAKVVYEADWSELDPAAHSAREAIVDLDVGDLVDERRSDYRFPRPHGGWVIGRAAVDPAGESRYDAGRIIPRDRSMSFELPRDAIGRDVALIGRTEAGGPLVVQIAGRLADRSVPLGEIELPERAAGRWFEHRTELPIPADCERLVLTPRVAAYEIFHLWVVGAPVE